MHFGTMQNKCNNIVPTHGLTQLPAVAHEQLSGVPAVVLLADAMRITGERELTADVTTIDCINEGCSKVSSYRS